MHLRIILASFLLLLGAQGARRVPRARTARQLMMTSKVLCRTSTTSPNATFHPLPDTVTPTRYKIRFRADTQRNKLYGHSLISIYIQNRTTTIELNAAKLLIHGASFHTGNIRVDSRMVYYCPVRESVVLQFPKPLYRGNANLTIVFTGNLKHMTDTGFIKIMDDGRVVVTDFGPIDARMMFPCWDEPKFKALFDIYLIVPKRFTALSNQFPNKRRFYSPSSDEIRFETTSPIAPYQLSTVYAPEVITVQNDNFTSPIKLSVQLINRKVKNLEPWQYALEIGSKLLHYYNYYSDIELPITKMDLVVMKEYQGPSMEKLGLSFFSEKQLFIENRTTATEEELTAVAETVAYSLAHQWFGNLVSVKQWNQFWLYESMANFMSKDALNSLEPHWRTWEHFTGQGMRRALQIDSSKHAKAISKQFEHPNEIAQVYSTQNVYRKSTFLLRMLRSIIGNENFQKGIRIFIKTFANQTASADDLWKCFHKAIDQSATKKNDQTGKFNKNIVNVFANWTQIAGFPVIHVEEKQVDTETRVLRLRQERFFELNSSRGSSPKQIWSIPVSVVNPMNPFSPSHQALMVDEVVEIPLNNIWEGDWVKLNPKFASFYRVHYSDEMLDKFFISIEEKLLPALDRLNLVDDLFALVRAGYVSTDVGLKFLWSYENEDNPNVWSVIVASMKELDILLSNVELAHRVNNDTLRGNYWKFARELLGKMYHKSGWYEDSSVPVVGQKMRTDNYASTNLREHILCTMGHFRGERFVNESRIKYEDYINGMSDLPLGILRCVFRAYSSFSNQSAFPKLFQFYNDYDLPEARQLFSYALGSTTRMEQIKNVVQFALKPTVRIVDAHIVLRELCQQSSQARQYILNMITEQFEKFARKFSTFNAMYTLLKDLVETFADSNQLKKLQKMLATDPRLQVLHQSLLLSFERVAINEHWLKRDLPLIEKFFTKQTHSITETNDEDTFSELSDNGFLDFEEFDKKKKK